MCQRFEHGKLHQGCSKDGESEERRNVRFAADAQKHIGNASLLLDVGNLYRGGSDMPCQLRENQRLKASVAGHLELQ